MLRAVVKKARPTFVAAGLESSASGGAITINKPTGTLENDLMIAVYSGDGTQTWTPATGWTEVLDYNTRAGIGVAWKVATAAEGSTYTFTSSGGGTNYNGFIVTYSGAAFDVMGTATTSGTSSIAISGITVSENLSILLSFVAQGATTNATFTPASGFSSLASNLTNRPPSQLWSKNIESGATGNQTFTSTESASLSGVLFSIKPA